MKMMDELYSKYDKMYEMETKYMSFREMRDYRELVRETHHIKLVLALIGFGITAAVYLLIFLMCLLTGLSFWVVDSPVMLLMGVSCTVVATTLLNDKGRRTRKKMDEMYIRFEEN